MALAAVRVALAHKAHHRTKRTTDLIVQEHSKECFFCGGGGKWWWGLRRWSRRKFIRVVRGVRVVRGALQAQRVTGTPKVVKAQRFLGITGDYWGLLGALTAFAYWGAREGEGCGNSHPCQGATMIGLDRI